MLFTASMPFQHPIDQAARRTAASQMRLDARSFGSSTVDTGLLVVGAQHVVMSYGLYRLHDPAIISDG